jgi:hypothetical protein
VRGRAAAFADGRGSGGSRRDAGGVVGVVKLDHLYRLTDSTGIWQHARGTRPDPEFGYCLDDNARALIAAIRLLALTGESGLLDYIRHYLAFVERCQRPDGRFRNFMAADGAWLDDVGSEDAQGRAVWALGFAARHSAQAEVRLRALRCLDKALPALGQLSWLRSRAFALLGLSHWRHAEPTPELDALATRLSAPLLDAYRRTASPDWRWFEDRLSYCNARLSEALILTALDDKAAPSPAARPSGMPAPTAGAPAGPGETATPGAGAGDATAMAEAGVASLDWLCRVLEVDGCISLIGNRGWYARGGERAVYDQQAVDAAALVAACAAAHRLTGEPRFRRWAELGGAWFQGRNPGRRPLIDPDSGGCYDGLLPDGVNANQGAESLLAWLLTWCDLAEQGWLQSPASGRGPG